MHGIHHAEKIGTCHRKLQGTTPAHEIANQSTAITVLDGSEFTVDERHQLLRCVIQPASADRRIFVKTPDTFCRIISYYKNKFFDDTVGKGTFDQADRRTIGYQLSLPKHAVEVIN